MNGKRGRLANTAVAAAFTVASACSAVLSIEPANRTGPCALDLDCPTQERCVLGLCRDVCAADSDCASPLACAEVSGARACLPAGTSVPLTGSDAGAVTAPVLDAASSHLGAENDADDSVDAPGDACASCAAPFSTCVQGACRTTTWITPENAYSTPAPSAPIGNRIYGPLEADTIYAQRIQVQRPGWLLRLGFLASTTQIPARLRLGLYDELAGYAHTPRVRMGPALTNAQADDGRQELPLDEPWHISPGTYWIAVIIEDVAFSHQSSGAMLPTLHAHASPDGDRWLDPFSANQAVPTPALELGAYAVIANDPL